jgi:hypothetical protein
MGLFELIVMIVMLGLAIAHVKLLFKMQRIKDRFKHLRGAPAFDPALVDCYVRFKGRVDLPNMFNSVLRRHPCVFFQSRVFAEWETKLKKPKKGMVSHRKTLFEQVSPVPVIKVVDAKGVAVYLDSSVLAVSSEITRLNQEKTVAPTCPWICGEQADPKYKLYTATEKWLTEGDDVHVYGKLEKTSDNQLMLTPTGHAYYPTGVMVESPQGGSGLRDVFAETDKRINSLNTKLVITALLFLGGLLYLLYISRGWA